MSEYMWWLSTPVGGKRSKVSDDTTVLYNIEKKLALELPFFAKKESGLKFFFFHDVMKKKEFWVRFFFGKKNINNPQNMSSSMISVKYGDDSRSCFF